MQAARAEALEDMRARQAAHGHGSRGIKSSTRNRSREVETLLKEVGAMTTLAEEVIADAKVNISTVTFG